MESREIEEAELPELRQEIVRVAEGKSELLGGRFFPGPVA
jgi:hypothetical protein